jgi:hypothetical protein
MASEINLRLYEELNDFLPVDKRKRRFAYRLDGIRNVGDLLARLGVPDYQVELVLINGDSASFSDHLRARDFVSIYPVFESFDVTDLIRMRKKPLRRIRFLAGPGLLRLARYLRKVGLDTLDSGSRTLEEVVQVAEAERRILLTRNPSLLKSRRLSRVYFVREAEPRRQLVEVLSRFNLSNLVPVSADVSHPSRPQHQG